MQKTNALKKILLIRFSSIGDIVLTTPVVRCIKSQKKVLLHVLTKNSYKGIYEANPNIDKVHSFNRSVNECIHELITEKFDVIIDLQKNIRSRKIKSRLKVTSYSFPKVNIEKWMLVNLNINRLPDIHIVNRYFEAVKSIGIINDGKGLEYYIPVNDEVNINEISPQLSNGYVGFVIGGQHNTKILPPEKCSKIISEINLPVVLLGGKEDKGRGDEIIQFADSSNIINLCGVYNLNQSSSIVKQANVIVTNDTGLMHIAAAFRKHIVSIWGNTVPEFGMYPYLPDNTENFIISEVYGLKCRPCSKIGYNRCPKKHFKCMLDQDTERIINFVNSVK